MPRDPLFNLYDSPAEENPEPISFVFSKNSGKSDFDLSIPSTDSMYLQIVNGNKPGAEQKSFKRIAKINFEGFTYTSNKIALNQGDSLKKYVESRFAYGNYTGNLYGARIKEYFGLTSLKGHKPENIEAYQLEILSRSFDVEPYKEINFEGKEGSGIILQLDNWTSNSTSSSKGLLVKNKVKLNIELDKFEVTKAATSPIANVGIYVYSEEGWNDHWLREKDGKVIFTPGESNNDVRIVVNDFRIEGNIHRAVSSQGHNNTVITSNKGLLIDTLVDYPSKFNPNRKSNALLIVNGSVSLKGADFVSLSGSSLDPDHDTFNESFVIRGGDVADDSCGGCSRKWDADFKVSSNKIISIDSNWGAIFMKSSSGSVESGKDGEKISLNIDYYAKAILEAPSIKITASGTSSDGLVNAMFRAESDNSKEASILLGTKNENLLKKTDVLSIDYKDVLDKEKKQDFFYSKGENAKIELVANEIYLNQQYQGETGHADVRNLFFADEKSSINIEGKLIAHGNTVARNGGLVNFVLENGSAHTGAVLDLSYQAIANSSLIASKGKVTITGAGGANWNVKSFSDEDERGIIFGSATRYDSTVDTISSFNATKERPFNVNLTATPLTRATLNFQPQNLNVANLKSDGFVNFSLGFDDKDGSASTAANGRDTVTIHEGNGTHGIYVNYLGAHDSEEPESFRNAWLVMDDSEKANFVLTNKDEAVDIGIYKYVLAKDTAESPVGEKYGTANYWYLKRAGTPVDPGSPDEPSQPSQPDTPLTPGADTVLSFAGSQRYLHWADLQDLRKRLGEIRYGSQDGAWARGIAQKDLTDGENGASGLKQNYYGVNFGADHLVSVGENRMWLVGGSFNLGRAKQKTRSSNDGSGSTDRYGVNAYLTWAANNGCYADLVLSADYFRQDITTRANDVKQKGKYNTYGLGASIEIGKMFSSESRDLSWGPWYRHTWIEPQLQLSYYWLSGEKYRLSNKGIRVHIKSEDSLIGRAGVVIGTKWNYGENYGSIDKRYVQAYVKGGVKHDFLGNYRVSLNDQIFSNKIGKTTGYYGFGADWQAGSNTRFYMQLEREKGSHYTKEYEISVGMKYQF